MESIDSEAIQKYFDFEFDYQKDLELNKDKYPTELYKIITANWYHYPLYSRCPHDAWINKIEIEENRDNHEMSINIELLGAYHDLKIIYRYKDVQQYEIGYQGLFQKGTHGDWLDDRFIPTPDGNIAHYVSLAMRAHIQIECPDINIEYIEDPAKENPEHILEPIISFLKPSKIVWYNESLHLERGRRELPINLYSNDDFDEKFKIEIYPEIQKSKDVFNQLKKYGANETCFVLTEYDPYNWKECSLKETLNRIVGSRCYAAVVACIPGKLIYCKGPGENSHYILQR